MCGDGRQDEKDEAEEELLLSDENEDLRSLFPQQEQRRKENSKSKSKSKSKSDTTFPSLRIFPAHSKPGRRCRSQVRRWDFQCRVPGGTANSSVIGPLLPLITMRRILVGEILVTIGIVCQPIHPRIGSQRFR